MCLARVKLLDGSERGDEPMRDVARIEVTASGLVVTGLMGETRTVEGSIKSVDFLDSVVVVESGKD